VARHLAAGHCVFLDAQQALGDGFARRFPGIAGTCRRAGIDPAKQPIPVAPAAHFHMGGVAVDATGRTSVDGLWACGEVASTGLHGANRLASNSLLEAACCARWVAEDVAAASALAGGRSMPTPTLPPPVDPSAVRPIMSRQVGLLRDREGLQTAIRALWALAATAGPSADPATLGLMLAVAALRREESRGAHARTDFPARSPAAAQRQSLRLCEATDAARRIAATAEPIALRA
jgi:L-aspartate oxidase